MTTLGPSLGARFSVSSKENIAKRKKASPRNKTLTAATTAELHQAVNALAIKLHVTRSRAIELAVEEMCAKHSIEIRKVADD